MCSGREVARVMLLHLGVGESLAIRGLSYLASTACELMSLRASRLGTCSVTVFFGVFIA